MNPQAVVIKNYHIAENDKGQILLTFPDLGVDTKEATYTLAGDDLMLGYPGDREVKLPNIPPAMCPVIQVAKVILIVESTNTGLARAYEAENSSAPPTKRPRVRL